MADLDLENVRTEIQALAVIADGIVDRLTEWHRLANKVWHDRDQPMTREEIAAIRLLARKLRRHAAR